MFCIIHVQAKIFGDIRKQMFCIIQRKLKSAFQSLYLHFIN